MSARPPRRRRVPVRADLVGVEPYGAPQLDVPVRLNTNETPFPPPAAFGDQLAKRVASLELHRYPDRRAWTLRTALGARFGLPADRVWAANGSNEVLLQLFQAYGGPGRTLLLFRPGYSAHPLIARVAATDHVEVELDAGLRLSPATAAEAVRAHRPDLVCVASPNNPTGIPVTLDTVRALHDAGDGLVVCDEAYVEFGAASAVELLDELPRLAVCRTFSKAFRLAGARLGYLLAHDWVVDDLRKVRLPYHLDAMTQEAGTLACELAGEMTAHIQAIVAERERVRAALTGLGGVDVYDSAANFLLFRTRVSGLWEALLDCGVLVRDFSDRPRLTGCLRVTIGTPTENDAFLAALEESLHARA
ncbi:histidinol-phosphate transaminase [soil metagenome]